MFRRTIAGFFLLEIVGSLAAPSLSWALPGPSQPEFTGYESAGSTDMVNLSTGDMTYNLPVLQVPGPETTFSLPLTYRAGIGVEQEASWVGLGWSMNPGAIVRSVNGYPDDACGELATNSYTDPGHHGWYGGVPSVLDLGWDSETGHYGSASLLGLVNASWSGGKLQSGDLIGIGATRGQGFTLDPMKFTMGLITVASLGSAAAASAATEGVALGTKQLAIEAGKQATGSLAMGVGVATLGKVAPTGEGYNGSTTIEHKNWFRTDYWVFVNDTAKQSMFGSLYFYAMGSKINTNFNGNYSDANAFGPNVYDGPANYPNSARKGYKFNYSRNYTQQGNFTSDVGGDLQQTQYPNSSYYNSAGLPLNIAHDDFMVLGPGITGAIRPQRLDVGSVAYPRQMLENHDKYSLVPWAKYKVPFRYENTASNTYTYTDNTNPTATPVGIDGSHWGNSQLTLTDPKLYDSTMASTAARTEADRLGLSGRRFAQGKHIAWYSNKEINDAYEATPARYPIAEFQANPAGSLCYQQLVGYTEIPAASPDDQPTYEPNYQQVCQNYKNAFRKARPEQGIGAFAITAEDGTTYHYSLPVYHLRQFSKTNESTDPTKGVAIHRTGAARTDVYNYATAWLLTAITGPDYVDLGTPGCVDDQDLGAWVTFGYGKFSQQYKWRQPYVGVELSDIIPAGYTTPTGQARTVQEGAKETYYLNSIHTRSHTALFLKSTRRDGRSNYGNNPSNLGIDESTPASSLRLDEVILLSNQDLASIQATTGFGVNAGNNASTNDNSLGGKDTYAAVLDQFDVAANSATRQALNQKALKRVVFNYSYRLCPGTPNSFASATAPPALGTSYDARGRLGKLTLESIATYGPNNVKLIPDFRFDYGVNPTYDPAKVDAFGMYSSTSQLRPAADFATASQDGAAWSLNKITNPLGAITTLTYERDQYASVSEFYNGSTSLTDQGQFTPQLTSNGVLMGNNSFDLTTLYKAHDKVQLAGLSTAYYDVTVYDYNGNPSYSSGSADIDIDGEYEIASVSPNSITLTSTLPMPEFDGSTYDYEGKSYSATKTDWHCYPSIRVPANRNGGNIRVAAVSAQDETGKTYVTRYRYTTDFPGASNSSGVLSKEPEKLNAPDFSNIYTGFDYPTTPVMYGRTTVLHGNFTTPDDIESQEEYTFYTAKTSMVTANSTVKRDNTSYYPFLSASGSIGLYQAKNTVIVDIGLLGQVKSIRKLNGRGTPEFTTTFTYGTTLPNVDNMANQAVFVESALTSEFLAVDNTKSTGAYYNLNWTTKRYLPTVMQSITTTTNNIAATTINGRYDFLSGSILETSLQNSLGDRYRSRQVPAYTIYGSMGPKNLAQGNQHMLTQIAATYTYKENGTASPAVLGVGIQTWNNSWPTSYRRYDAVSDTYGPEASTSQPVWRQHRTFIWQSPRLNADGTYANFADYSWQPTATQASSWLNAGEVTLYDHYSRPLESKDVNGQYAAQKAGYDQSLVTAAAGNARYTEFAYSGAEDQLATGANVGHFGGEVRRDGGQQSTDQVHTGQYSCLLPSTSPLGMTYKAHIGNANDLRLNRTYRANVWVYNSDVASSSSNGARLYVAFNGTTSKEVGIADAATKRAGNWYLLQLDIPVQANVDGQVLTVGCRNAGGSNVYVDDFRFRPLDAPLQASVYDPATHQLTYSLDNDNFFTHYTYDGAGKVIKVAREVVTPGASTAAAERVVKESSYSYAQLRTPNWVDLGTSCEVDSNGNYTGNLVRKSQDVNSSSPSYGQVRTDAVTPSAGACPP